MRVITATEAKNRLGEALAFDDDDSLMIRKNNKESCIVLSAGMGRRVILGAYSSGAISRSSAMRLLGLPWYGDLLAALDAAGIARPSVSDETQTRMIKDVTTLLGDA